MKLQLVILLVCLVAVISAKGKKPKQPKGVKWLVQLCNAHNSSNIVVQDNAFDILFGDFLGRFCDSMYNAMGERPKKNGKQVDGVKVLGKVCKWYSKKYVEEPTEGPLVGLEAVCIASEEAKARSVNDKDSKKMLARLNGLCVAKDAGNLEVKNANFSELFDNLDDFCDAFMDESSSAMTKRSGSFVDGIKVLGQVCDWYNDKFGVVGDTVIGVGKPQGPLGMLGDICADYDEILQNDDDDDDHDDDDNDEDDDDDDDDDDEEEAEEEESEESEDESDDESEDDD